MYQPPKTIPEILQSVTDDFEGMHPYQINNGNCDEWGNQALESLDKKGFAAELWETVWDFADTTHIFLRIGGKFYDAECLEGVEDHMSLPIFKKLFAANGKRQPVWLMDYKGGAPIESLEYLRGELQQERISWGELHELQCLVPFIDEGDVELMEAAGVPEVKIFKDEVCVDHAIVSQDLAKKVQGVLGIKPRGPHDAVKMALDILTPFQDAGSIYEDYKAEDGWTDEEYERMLQLLKSYLPPGYGE